MLKKCYFWHKSGFRGLNCIKLDTFDTNAKIIQYRISKMSSASGWLRLSNLPPGALALPLNPRWGLPLWLTTLVLYLYVALPFKQVVIPVVRTCIFPRSW